MFENNRLLLILMILESNIQFLIKKLDMSELYYIRCNKKKSIIFA